MYQLTSAGNTRPWSGGWFYLRFLAPSACRWVPTGNASHKLGALAFPGTTSWFDTARLLTTLSMASRLMPAPQTWMWPCSTEMLVELGAWEREEGGRGSHTTHPFCHKLELWLIGWAEHSPQHCHRRHLPVRSWVSKTPKQVPAPPSAP